MIHLGDITKINGADIPIVDCITAGSPCQDLSVAGKRAGLAGERSGLFHEQIRVIKEMREHDRRTNKRTDEFIRPRFMVWENVPGALSSNKGEDFRCVLEETVKIVQPGAVIPKPDKGKWSKSGCIMGDGWSVAWRIHDAQFWGVPQRRKRIALVADFAGASAPEILFVRKGLQRDTEQSESERETAAGDIEDGTGKASWGIIPGIMSRLYSEPTKEVSLTIIANSGDNKVAVAYGAVALENHPTDCRVKISDDGVVQTLTSRMGTGGGNVPLVMGKQTTAYGICSKDSNSMKSANPNSGFYEADTSRTIDGNGGNPGCNQGGIAVIECNGTRPSHKGGRRAKDKEDYETWKEITNNHRR